MRLGSHAVALIPARGGSKRLPRKNIADFFGRPIIGYTIEAATKSGCFTRVVVSTEDAEIAEVAARFGAEVDRRPASLASDAATVGAVCVDFLERERAAERAWQHLCVLYPTAPLRTAEDIRGVMGLLEPGRCDFAMAVTRYDLPPHQALKLGPEGALEPMWPDLIARRSSDVPALCVDNGSTYGVGVPAFLKQPGFYGPGLRGHMMPRERSFDIDTGIDLDLARWAGERLGLSATRNGANR